MVETDNIVLSEEAAAQARDDLREVGIDLKCYFCAEEDYRECTCAEGVKYRANLLASMQVHFKQQEAMKEELSVSQTKELREAMGVLARVQFSAGRNQNLCPACGASKKHRRKCPVGAFMHKHVQLVPEHLRPKGTKL